MLKCCLCKSVVPILEDNLKILYKVYNPRENPHIVMIRIICQCGSPRCLQFFHELNDNFMSIFSLQRLALHEINTSRYNEEFHEVCKLGDGEFGSVYKCINRLDGCVYAIKKSKTPVAGSAYE